MPECFKNNISNPLIWARMFAMFETETLSAFWIEFREKTGCYQRYLQKRKFLSLGVKCDFFYLKYIPLAIERNNFIQTLIKPV